MSYGPGFLHIETYARKGKLKASGKPASTVDWVLGEAARFPGQCPHVDHPLPPRVVHGLSVDALWQLHDKRADAARMPYGKTTRAARATQHTLLTAIVSYPVPRDDPAFDQFHHADWEARNAAYFRQWFGADCESIVAHDDENYPHLHVFVVPSDVRMRAADLHPGEAARQAVRASIPKHMPGLLKLVGAAYGNAMRDSQDAYHECVSLPSGLTRKGPSRDRLTRAQWHAEKDDAVQASYVYAERVQAERDLLVIEVHRSLALEQIERANEQSLAARAVIADLQDQVVSLRAEADQLKTQIATLSTRVKALVGRVRSACRRFLTDPGSVSRELPDLDSDLDALLCDTVLAAPAPASVPSKMAGVGMFRRRLGGGRPVL